MMPRRPDALRDARDSRPGAAFDMMQTGHAQDGAEQQEDELLKELQHGLDGVNQTVLKLRGVQQKDKGDGAGGAKIDDDGSDTGSPSMQGMAG